MLDHVTSRWGILVMVLLRERMHRFSDLRKRIGGVSEKMLAQTLKVLEQDGFVDRHAYPEVPPRVEYTLTAMGEELADHLNALGGWVSDNLWRVLAERNKREHKGAAALNAAARAASRRSLETRR